MTKTTSTGTFNWDDIKMTDFYKFDTIGQTLAGVVTDVGMTQFDSGDLAPQIVLTQDGTGNEVVLTAGQADLKRKLKSANVQRGTHVTITYTGDAPAGKFTAKRFSVEVTDSIPF
jgi:hypothetical protein